MSKIHQFIRLPGGGEIAAQIGVLVARVSTVRSMTRWGTWVPAGLSK